MEIIIIAVVLQAIVFGLFCGYIAKEKGRRYEGWFFLGFFFSIVAVLALIAIPKIDSAVQAQTMFSDTPFRERRRDCTFCGESVKLQAIICRFCGKELKQPLVSKLSQTVVKNDFTVEILIEESNDGQWMLSIINASGVATEWEDAFVSERAALDEAINEIEKYGIESFN